MTDVYRKWPESVWSSADIDWKAAQKITAGIDVGTTSTQAVVICDGQLFAYANIATGIDFKGAGKKALDLALGSSGMTLADIACVVATGWGAKNVDFACKTLDEVQCHAKGARFMFGPSVKTVVDLGGQTVKAIRLFDWDRVRDVYMGDKCATGMGRNIETMCTLLEIPITEIGEKSLDVPADPEPVSTTCFAYAQTETMGLFGRPEFRCEPLSENEVYASHLYAVAWRALGVIGKLQSLDVGDITIEKELGLTGGVAKNPGVAKRIAAELKVDALTSDYDPMLAGAIGAALLA